MPASIYLEEYYTAFSASSIWDDNGRVAGVLNSALETTERVIEEFCFRLS